MESKKVKISNSENHHDDRRGKDGFGNRMEEDERRKMQGTRSRSPTLLATGDNGRNSEKVQVTKYGHITRSRCAGETLKGKRSPEFNNIIDIIKILNNFHLSFH